MMADQDDDRTQTHVVLTKGTKVLHYEIIHRIGAGGMGEVYLAEDTKLDRRVALKFLPPAICNDPDARERLVREAKAASKLDHPNILTIHGIEESDGRLFIVMAYVKGIEIDKFVSSAGRDAKTITNLALQIADGLQHAHEAGILHRDLKPANILVDDRGQVRILDFGLARISGASRLTQAGSFMGTPAYSPPEVIKGEDAGAAADIYSLGVILYQLLSNRLPFKTEDSSALFYSILQDAPPPFSDVDPPVPSSLQAITMRCLEKNPMQRYQSSGELKAELEGGGPADAMRPENQSVISQPNANRRGNTFGKRTLWLAVFIICAVALFVSIRLGVFDSVFSTQGNEVTPGSIRSIAVLPLDNYSGDPGQDYFAEGMTDELTATLATISKLRVISRGSAMQFSAGNRPATPEIAKVLNVDAVVEGSVTRIGDRVKITAQLIDAREDRHLWARSFERNSSDVLALQAELATAIANEISVQLTPSETSRLAAAPQVDPAAHDAYLKGRYFFNRPSDDNLRKAIAQFEEAIKLSPDFAAAYSGLSDAYLWAGYNEGFMTASEARPLAEAAARKAVDLDANSAEAHTSLAVFKLFYEYDWAGSELEFRRAIELNPSYAYAHDQFVLALAFQGRFDEAIAEGKKAVELDPLSPQILIDNCVAYIIKGDFETASKLAREAGNIDPAYFFPVMIQGWIDCEQGKFREAIQLLVKAKEMGSPPFVTAWLAYAYGAAGEIDRAKEQREELKSLSLNGQVSPFNLALVSLGLGEKEQAIKYLEQAYESDSQWLGWLKGERIFDPLRNEPQFVALLKKLGFEQ